MFVKLTDYLDTVLDGELPLQPVITPAWAIAGVILLGTGVVYALVGIKTKWLHTFFSTAFLASLGTAVLIVYVMIPPVGNAAQGAYVVAVVCTGAILGGLAIVFKEVTECLGCLLGGFCLSMWFLALQPGGLIGSTGGRVGFIAAFTLATFCLYFTQWTRNYGLIGCISFSGATIAVLGIDCFSRAGLKEFWAYLWALNDNVFPLGAVTYPLTRGIRVELAVTILIFLAGIVSQLKLWRIIKERRSKRDAELAEGERSLRAEEEAVGRQVEETTSRERREWEQAYGDGSASQLGGSVDSGVGGMESEKRGRGAMGGRRYGNGTPAAMTLRSRSTTNGTEESVLRQSRRATPPSLANALAAVEAMTKSDGDGAVTIRVVEDDMPPSVSGTVPALVPVAEMETTVADGEGTQIHRHLSQTHLAQIPSVVPLPFRVSNDVNDDDRSSAATFADENIEMDVTGPEVQRRNFNNTSRAEKLVRRLSGNSAKFLRSLSQRSARTKLDKELVAAESREDLVEVLSDQDLVKNDSDSVIANLDDMSSVGDAELVLREERPLSMSVDVKVNLGGVADTDDPTPVASPPLDKGAMPLPVSKSLAEELNGPDGRLGLGDLMPTVSEGAIGLDDLAVPGPVQSALATESRVARQAEGADVTSSTDGPATKEGERLHGKKSTASIDSVTASLKTENLPPPLSRIALSYRTNEWAKHLSVAEAPEPEYPQPQPQPWEAIEESGSPIPDETAAPLDVDNLQQTAENAPLPVAAPRSASAMSGSSSRVSLTGYPEGPYRAAAGTLKTRSSMLLSQVIAEEGDSEMSGGLPAVPASHEPAGHPVAASPPPRELSSWPSVPSLYMPGAAYSSPQTLMGMRETMLRNKASYSYLVPTSAEIMPPITSQSSSDSMNLNHDSKNNYPGFSPTADMDDIPLSQRRSIILQSSNLSFNLAQPSRSSLRASASASPLNTTPILTAQATTFDSHQPLRHSLVPSEAIRQAQLANFRASLAADLRSSGAGLISQAANPRGEAPFPIPAGLTGSASMASLRGADGRESPVVGAAGADMQRNLEIQRNLLMEQKEAEVQRREIEKLSVERIQREFDERMRSGVMLEAHRDALRRMQKGARMGDE